MHLCLVEQPEIARGYYEAALAHASSPRETVSLLCRLAESYRQSPRAIQYVEDAARLANQVRDQGLRGWVQFLQTEKMSTPSPASQRRLYQLGHQLLEEKALPGLFLNRIRNVHLTMAGEFQDLPEIRRHAFELKRIPEQSLVAARFHQDLVSAYSVCLGHLSELIEHAERVKQIYENIGMPREGSFSNASLAIAHLQMGHWQRVRSIALEAISKPHGLFTLLSLYDALCKTWIYYDRAVEGLQWAERRLEIIVDFLLEHLQEDRSLDRTFLNQELGGIERIYRETGRGDEFRRQFEKGMTRLREAGCRTDAVWYFEKSVSRPWAKPVGDLDAWNWTAGGEDTGYAVADGTVTLRATPCTGFLHMTMPRLMRRITGDFVLQVALNGGGEVRRGVVGCFEQVGAGRIADSTAGGGGLLLVRDGRNNLRLFAESAAMRQVLEQARRCARDSAPALITGETGTGKELIARALHRLGPRARGPFVPLNCAAIPAELLERELFGHVRGAFTGAYESRGGLFEAADGGILFLDEIGDASPGLQARLLRVIEEQEVRRVGAQQGRKVDVRIVAATNRELRVMAVRGEFRPDLFYRLAGVEIGLAPLREHPDDIPPLAFHALEGWARRGEGEVAGIARAAVERLLDYGWPGNVRELIHVVEQAAGQSGGRMIVAGHLNIPRGTVESAKEEDGKGGEDIAAIAAALQGAEGNVAGAARGLGISRSTLYRRMRRLGIRPQRN